MYPSASWWSDPRTSGMINNTWAFSPYSLIFSGEQCGLGVVQQAAVSRHSLQGLSLGVSQLHQQRDRSVQTDEASTGTVIPIIILGFTKIRSMRSYKDNFAYEALWGNSFIFYIILHYKYILLPKFKFNIIIMNNQHFKEGWGLYYPEKND